MSSPNQHFDYAPPSSVLPTHRRLFAVLSTIIAVVNISTWTLLWMNKLDSFNPENLIAISFGTSCVGLAFGIYASWQRNIFWLAVFGMTINGGAVGVVFAGLAVHSCSSLLGA